METEELDNMLGTSEAAAILKVTPNMVRYLCRQGRIDGAEPVAGKWFIPVRSLKGGIPRRRPGRKPKVITERSA
jgi:hypothetical protein